METIKVNMSPNPLDVQTIHASQNDGEARQWEFELHNNGELIDTSNVTEQLFFKAYKGGTEQILPENTSTPTTSPFLGDIRYPQGLLTDQEFIYRQSPTESDGNAKIQTIYGNTLKWNQLVQNGDFASSNVWRSSMGTMTFSNNELTYKPTSIGNVYYENQVLQKDFNVPVNHVLFLHCETYAPYDNGFYMSVRTNNAGQSGVGISNVRPTPNSWSSFSKIAKLTNTMTDIAFYWSMDTRYTTNDTVKLRNVYIIDLTMLFGTEKAEEILAMGQTDGIAYFRSLFPLPYYQYDSGSLLSFNGTGIKTVGKNLLDKTLFSENSTVKTEQTSTGVKVISKNGGSYGNVRTMVISNLTPFIGKTFVLSANVQTSNKSGLALQVRDENNAEKAWRATYTTGPTSVSLTITDDFRNCQLNVYIYAIGGSGVVGDYSIYDNLQLEFGTSATSYEPYTSSTLSLPISAYFPTGMKSTDTAYDELTPTKASIRTGGYTFSGNETWTFYPSTEFWQAQVPITNYAKSSTSVKSSNGFNLVFVNNYFARVYLYNNPSLSDSSAMNSVFSNGTQIVYELATPTETSFTTASLVTENAEIPLSNEDNVLIGKCTEELSAEPGFHDAKIKLSDADGECYSNKIQLHVERSPQ